MATDEVFMDIPQVETMAKNFNSFGDVLDAVSKAMSALSMSLKLPHGYLLEPRLQQQLISTGSNPT